MRRFLCAQNGPSMICRPGNYPKRFGNEKNRATGEMIRKNKETDPPVARVAALTCRFDRFRRQSFKVFSLAQKFSLALKLTIVAEKMAVSQQPPPALVPSPDHRPTSKSLNRNPARTSRSRIPTENVVFLIFYARIRIACVSQFNDIVGSRNIYYPRIYEHPILSPAHELPEDSGCCRSLGRQLSSVGC